jgi:ribonuclease HI
MHFLIFTDGGARGNPGPAAAGYVIKNELGEVVVEGGTYLGVATNNLAEYKAVVAALQATETLCTPNKDDLQRISFFLDSKLVVEQLSGRFKIKNQNLAQIAQEINDTLKKRSISATFTHIPRAQNAHADALVNQVLDNPR